MIVAVCVAMVPATLYADDCEDERKAAEKASDDAFWACLTSATVCAISAGWGCVVAALYCTKKLTDAADAWGAYYNCTQN